MKAYEVKCDVRGEDKTFTVVSGETVSEIKRSVFDRMQAKDIEVKELKK